MFGVFGIVLFLSLQRFQNGEKATVIQDETVMQRKQDFEQQYNIPIEQFLGIQQTGQASSFSSSGTQ
jgi:hypothetical protein